MSLLLDTGTAGRHAAARRYLGASCRQASAGATAAVDAEVGQRRGDATDNSWLCVCRVGAGGGEEIHDRSRIVVSPLTSEAILAWSRFSQATQGKDRLGKQAAPPDRLYPTST